MTRTDGKSAPGEKHDACDYFVLDIMHDRHAYAALLAYAHSCEPEYPEFVKDLRIKAKLMTIGPSTYFGKTEAAIVDQALIDRVTPSAQTGSVAPPVEQARKDLEAAIWPLAQSEAIRELQAEKNDHDAPVHVGVTDASSAEIMDAFAAYRGAWTSLEASAAMTRVIAAVRADERRKLKDEALHDAEKVAKGHRRRPG